MPDLSQTLQPFLMPCALHTSPQRYGHQLPQKVAWDRYAKETRQVPHGLKRASSRPFWVRPGQVLGGLVASEAGLQSDFPALKDFLTVTCTPLFSTNGVSLGLLIPGVCSF